MTDPTFHDSRGTAAESTLGEAGPEQLVGLDDEVAPGAAADVEPTGEAEPETDDDDQTVDDDDDDQTDEGAEGADVEPDATI